MTPLVAGPVLGLAVGVFGTGTGLDRDRAYYPVVAVVVASYYALFAAMGASTETVVIESLIGVVFVAAAVVGFKRSLWIVAATLAAHGLFDFGHGAVLSNPGKPVWWPPFCATIDVTMAGYLAWLLKSGRLRAAP